ncbi:hypothetical protein [Desulfonatronospira thiodismutans]|nr:hypothetical protein [Desulfonatronospira thiodismutans]
MAFPLFFPIIIPAIKFITQHIINKSCEGDCYESKPEAEDGDKESN